MRTGGMALAILMAGGVAGAGCSTVLGVDADRHVATPDAGSSTPPSKADLLAWGCTHSPQPSPQSTAQEVVTLTVIDPIQMSVSGNAVDGGSDLETLSGEWIPDVGVRPCSLLDTTCNEGPTPTPTDRSGQVSFILAGDFHGYFELSNPALVPGTLYPGRLLAAATDSLPAFGLTPGELDELSLATTGSHVLGAEAGVGVAVVTIYDCQDHQAPGISVKYTHLGLDSLPFYFNGGLPDPRATETDSFGLAGAINVPAGTEMVVATRTSDQSVIGKATFDVRPGAISSAFIRVRTQ
jgi:hypothetical protein